MLKSVTAARADQIVCLRVGWTAYTTLLDELIDASAHRVCFDGETLEIMSPSAAHEKYIRLLERLLGLLAQESHIKLESFGSMTIRMEPRGAEPDSSYYVGNASAVIGKTSIDLTRDPPPDIALEVDLSRARLDKRRLYAALGIPEYWRYDGRQLRAYALILGEYEEIAESVSLRGLPLADVDRFMELRSTTDQTAIGAAWVEWLRSRRC